MTRSGEPGKNEDDKTIGSYDSHAAGGVEDEYAARANESALLLFHTSVTVVTPRSDVSISISHSVTKSSL